MNQAEKKIKAALVHAAEEHRKGVSPDDAVAKAASFYELNPEMTHRVVEGFNIGKTNSTIARAEDKTASFPIADIGNVMQKVFVDSPIKVAAPLNKQASVDAGYSETLPDFDFDFVGNQKVASPLGDFREQVQQINGLKQEFEHELSKIAQDIIKQEMRMSDALRDLGEFFVLSENQGKFAEFEQQVLSEYGEGARGTLTVIHELAGVKEARYEGLPKTGSVFNSSAAHVHIDTLMEATDDYHAAQTAYGTKLAEATQQVDELMAMAKEAGGLTPPPPPSAADALLFKQGGDPGFKLPDISRLPLVSVEAPAHSLFSSARSGLESANTSAYERAHSKALEQQYKAPKDEADMELDNAKRQTILMRLMSDDDTIAKMDPNHVTSAYNTLLGIAPDVTLQPEIVRAFLHASGANQAVDPFTAKQLADLQGQMGKNKILATGKTPPPGT